MPDVILARIRSIVRNLLRRERIEQDLDDELRAALELLIDEHRRRGLSAPEARRAPPLERPR